MERPFAEVSALLLAGGRSTRFGGDKLEALLGQVPLLAHAARAALALFGEVLVVAKDPERYRPLLDAAGLGADAALRLCSDRSPRQTPLAGLEAGLAGARGAICFAAGADMPFAARPGLLRALRAALEGHDAAAPRFGGAPQPLCALYRAQPARAAAQALLAARAAGPRALLEELRTAWLDYETIEPGDPEGLPFLDADTPEALRELSLRLRG